MVITIPKIKHLVEIKSTIWILIKMGPAWCQSFVKIYISCVVKLQYATFRSQASCGMRLKAIHPGLQNTNAVSEPYIHAENTWRLTDHHHFISSCETLGLTMSDWLERGASLKNVCSSVLFWETVSQKSLIAPHHITLWSICLLKKVKKRFSQMDPQLNHCT